MLAVFDVGVHAGAPYIVSELLDGESLRSRLQQARLPPLKAIDYARQAATGLAAAHDKGIVHRDVKPDNLFITGDGRIKILDFGIAKLTRPADDGAPPVGAATDTEAGMVVGTAGYMSPEQVRGEAGRWPVRHLQPRRHSLRDADRASGVHPRDRGRYDGGDPQGGSGRTAAGRRSAAARTHRVALPGESARGAFSVGARSGVRSGVSVGNAVRDPRPQLRSPSPG